MEHWCLTIGTWCFRLTLQSSDHSKNAARRCQCARNGREPPPEGCASAGWQAPAAAASSCARPSAACLSASCGTAGCAAAASAALSSSSTSTRYFGASVMLVSPGAGCAERRHAAQPHSPIRTCFLGIRVDHASQQCDGLHHAAPLRRQAAGESGHAAQATGQPARGPALPRSRWGAHRHPSRGAPGCAPPGPSAVAPA